MCFHCESCDSLSEQVLYNSLSFRICRTDTENILTCYGEKYCVNAASRQVGESRESAAAGVEQKNVCNKQQNKEKFNLTTEICNAAYWIDVEEQSKSNRKTKISCSAGSTRTKSRSMFRWNSYRLCGSVGYRIEHLVGIRRSGTLQIWCCAPTCRIFVVFFPHEIRNCSTPIWCCICRCNIVPGTTGNRNGGLSKKFCVVARPYGCTPLFISCSLLSVNCVFAISECVRFLSVRSNRMKQDKA